MPRESAKLQVRSGTSIKRKYFDGTNQAHTGLAQVVITVRLASCLAGRQAVDKQVASTMSIATASPTLGRTCANRIGMERTTGGLGSGDA